LSTPIPPFERLLIVKSSSIGDVVHALPVVEAIKHAKPDLTIGWVVRKRCADVLTGNPVIDHLHIVDNKPSLGDLLRLRRELRAQRYEVALDMQGLFLSGLYAVLSGAPIRIGIDRNRENNKLFLTHPVIPGKPENPGTSGAMPTASGRHVASDPNGRDRHAVDILYGFAEYLGVDVEHTDFPPQAYLAQGADAALLAEIRRGSGRKICLNVGASSMYKQWPVDHWSTLAAKLLEAGDTVVFVGDKRDAEVVKQVTSTLSGASSSSTAAGHLASGFIPAAVVDVSGRTNLRQLAAVLQACDIVITGDTGPMHIAVAVGTPTVALFGSTNPDRTGPYGKRNVVLNMHLACSPCYRKPTCNGRVDCMRDITPEAVMKAVEDKLRITNV